MRDFANKHNNILASLGLNHKDWEMGLTEEQMRAYDLASLNYDIDNNLKLVEENTEE